MPETTVDGGTKTDCRRPAQRGTPRGYQLGCRCQECTAANTRAVKLYRYRTDYGKYPVRVDATETKQKLADLIAAGWSCQAIADRLGVARITVHRYLRRERVRPETAENVAKLWGELAKPEPKSAAEKQSVTRTLKYADRIGVGRGEAGRLYQAGMTQPEIAKLLGITQQAVSLRLKGNARRTNRETVAEYQHFKSFGMSDERIATRLGITPDALRKALATAAQHERAATEQLEAEGRRQDVLAA